MMYIDHIGIAVNNLEEAVKTYEKLLNTTCYKRERLERDKVETAFFQTGESKIELLGGTDPDSVISGFLRKRGEGIHHIAFEVEDLESEVDRLDQLGFELINEIPGPGADNKRVVFLYPKSNHGVLVELCESIEAP